MIKFITKYAGANIKIEKTNENEVYLRQEIRDTTEWWFYWNFGAVSDCDAEVTFNFTNGDVIGNFGPAISRDLTEWKYDKENSFISHHAFKYKLTANKPVYFAFAAPYQVKDFEKFVKEVSGLKKEYLTVTNGGRNQLFYTFGNEKSNKGFLIAARHHACESVASFVLEGLVKYLVENENSVTRDMRLDIIPFVDIDGVENGDQGKSREPHDHNRDYLEEPLYSTIKAIYGLYENRNLVFAADLHCPGKYGGIHDYMSLIEGYDYMAKAQQDFSDILEEKTNGKDIEYKRKNNVVFGTFWNKLPCANSLSFFIKKGAKLGFTFENPYVGERDKPYSAEELRAFGENMAKAFIEYYEKYVLSE